MLGPKFRSAAVDSREPCRAGLTFTPEHELRLGVQVTTFNVCQMFVDVRPLSTACKFYFYQVT